MDAWQEYFDKVTDKAIQDIMEARLANQQKVGRNAAKIYLGKAMDKLEDLIRRFPDNS